MAFVKAEKIWMNGRLIPWEQATVHVLSHVIHYGSCIFEGIRCYKTQRGPAVFRLRDHADRLFDGCRIYRMEIPYSREEIEAAILETVRVNKLEACYIRPLVYRGYESLGVDPFPCPIDVAIAAYPWGAYLGKDAAEKGVDVMVSSWRRPAPDTLPAMAKASANYMNSQLIKMEALVNGYVEGIALDAAGYVSEGSGENLFLAKKGVLHTPPLTASILPGITRQTIVQLAQDLKIPLIERSIPREALYTADEVFFVGTAAEVTPIRTIDRVPVARGKRGEITSRFQAEFRSITSGQTDDRHRWLSPI
ncbi:MAG: branched chain amino acid aminotransferase [Acidobacteria bacterium 13_1_20CM_2_68_7]|nr:MAG: branched chain amino acid aminotransferase [Acidobacteria bacterium 13_1_20CM_2_68_7]